MIYEPSAVIAFEPLTFIGVPTASPWSRDVLTVTSLEPVIVVIEEIFGIVVSPLLEKNDGVLLISSTVSHLVGCRPYSKSVSMRFSGSDTRSLVTGSINSFGKLISPPVELPPELPPRKPGISEYLFQKRSES